MHKKREDRKITLFTYSNNTLVDINTMVSIRTSQLMVDISCYRVPVVRFLKTGSKSLFLSLLTKNKRGKTASSLDIDRIHGT